MLATISYFSLNSSAACNVTNRIEYLLAAYYILPVMSTYYDIPLPINIMYAMPSQVGGRMIIPVDAPSGMHQELVQVSICKLLSF
jgi:hypothetical protein